ncbi:glycosyltransferase [Streptomyces sp. NPDC048483]|uniref:glycosyltransferase n=1 Tax=Streptomyces sp. NPDC048483 TaxID=3154927 RepID=UPI003414D71D
MRILFTVSDYAAHYYPMVPLGWAFQAAGHEVRVACAPSQTALVSRAGLTPLPILGGPDMMVRGRLFHYFAAVQNGIGRLGMPLHPVTGEVLDNLWDFDFTAYKRANRVGNIAAIQKSFDDTVAFARDWRPHMVFHDILSSEGVLAAKVTGVPAACHLWGAIGTDEDAPGVDLVPPDHTGTFRRYGLPAMSADLIERVLDPCPAAVAAPTRAERLPVRFVPYNGPGPSPDRSLERPGRSGRPRVCVVWGNSLAKLLGPGSFLVPDIVRALAGLDIEVVVTTAAGAAGQIGPVPRNVRLLEDCPLNELLPSCDAVIYHGGAGCGMTAVAAGTPQLALPFTPEQSANAHRLVSTGAGLCHSGRTAGPAVIRDSVMRLLEDDSYRATALALREQAARLPTPAELVRELEASALAAA